jgi:hypothetical protein
MAGLSCIRPYPSAAPVQTPSNRPKTARIPGAESNAVTRGISVVPGFEKHISIPAAKAVVTSVSAPFMGSPSRKLVRQLLTLF